MIGPDLKDRFAIKTGEARAVSAAYDPATDRWAILRKMPASLGAFGIGIVNQKIYVIGGTNPLNNGTVAELILKGDKPYDLSSIYRSGMPSGARSITDRIRSQRRAGHRCARGKHHKLYVNGKLQNYKPGTSAQFSSSLNVGRQRYVDVNYAEFFTGAIDDVRIYSRALTPSEVMGLYTD